MTLIPQDRSGYPAEWTRDEKLFALNVQQYPPRPNWRLIMVIAVNAVLWGWVLSVFWNVVLRGLIHDA